MASALASHLEKILLITEGKLISQKDSKFLKQTIYDLKTGKPIIQEEIRKLTRKLIKQAKFYRNNNSYAYLIGERFYNVKEIPSLAEDILKRGGKFLEKHNQKFLFQMSRISEADTLSVKQVNYLEVLHKRLEEVILPFLEGKKFIPSFYSYNPRMYGRIDSLIRFAVNGKMAGAKGINWLEEIKQKWYDPKEKNLGFLRSSLRDYLEKKHRLNQFGDYKKIISDLERFYSLQN